MNADLGIPEQAVQDIVARALAEDLGPGDITTRSTIPIGARSQAAIIAKAEGVLAGLPVAEAVFRRLDSGINFQPACQEGDGVGPGREVARLAGESRAILSGERTALNFVQRLSGIATLTAQYLEAVKGTKARICDTRKTAPGLRLLDKYAVRVAGGCNHRTGLFDGILIKDNHIRAAGGIRSAVERVRRQAHHLLRVEVEAQSREQVEEAIAAGTDVIMLDNMNLEQVRQAVRFIAGRAETEVSGGITLETVRSYAECGVGYISVGELTHSPKALDFALEIIPG